MSTGAEEIEMTDQDEISLYSPPMERAIEINKFNFANGIPELIELVKLADFVAIDATIETTGLVLKNEEWNPTLKENFIGPFGEWYDEIKAKEKTYVLLEVGIAIFKRIPGKPNELETEVFNIPVLPACVDDNEIARFQGRATCPKVSFDGYAKEFIESAKFDINNPFYYGVPYLNKNLTKVADRYMLENPSFMIAPRKRHLNKYLMPTVYPHVNEQERRVITDRLKGVSKLFEAIAELDVPVVGHHLFLKLMFIYKDFFEYLPDTYPEYYEKIKKLFKIVYDTKYIACNLYHTSRLDTMNKLCLSSHTLYNLFREVNRFCSLSENSNDVCMVSISRRGEPYLLDAYDLMDGDLLEKDPQSYCYVAGFDAMLSGLVFLDLVKLLEWNDLKSPSLEFPSKDDELDIFLKGKKAMFLNKLYGEVLMPKKNGIIIKMNEKKKMRYELEKQEQKKKDERRRPLKLLVCQFKAPRITL